MNSHVQINTQPRKSSAFNPARKNAHPQFAGTKVHLVDASLLLQDIQEEMSFARSEKREEEKAKDELSIKDYDKYRQYEIFNKVLETYQQGEAFQDKEKHLLDTVKQRQPRHQQELFDLVEEQTEDKAEAFALMHALLKSNDLPSHVQNLVQDGITTYQRKYHRDIQAGVTTYPLSKEHAPKVGKNIETLQALYQKNIVHYKGILSTLAAIVQKLGLEQLETGASFLSRAVAQDMVSPIASRQPVFLGKILASLRGINFFRSIEQHISKTLQRLSKRFDDVQLIKRDDLLARFIEFLPAPGKASLLTDVTKKLNDEPEVLLLQELRFGIKSLPDYLFENKQEKRRIIYPINERIDLLIMEGA